MDLTQWDPQKESTLLLNGKWEFYWNASVRAGDFPAVKPDAYIDGPGTWNELPIDGKKLPGQGFATYRLHVKTKLPEGTVFGFRIYTFSSAYRLFVNDQPVASNGEPGISDREEVGEYRPK